jgi:hypothetical protein
MGPFHPGVCVMCVCRWINCILLLSFLNFFQNKLSIIHLILVSHPLFLAENFPTSTSMCSLFILGKSCVINCILVTYREMKDSTMMEFCWHLFRTAKFINTEASFRDCIQAPQLFAQTELCNSLLLEYQHLPSHHAS